MDTENEGSDNDVLSTYKNNIAYVILPSSTTRSNRRSMGWSNLTVGSRTLHRHGPAQDVPFFYMPSQLSELQSFKSIISTNISGIFIFK